MGFAAPSPCVNCCAHSLVSTNRNVPSHAGRCHCCHCAARRHKVVQQLALLAWESACRLLQSLVHHVEPVVPNPRQSAQGRGLQVPVATHDQRDLLLLHVARQLAQLLMQALVGSAVGALACFAVHRRQADGAPLLHVNQACHCSALVYRQHCSHSMHMSHQYGCTC